MPTTETEQPYRTEPPFDSDVAWRGGAIAGILATAATGVVVTAMDLTTIRIVIPALYGQSGNLVAGWIAHLLHGSLFGVIFAVILTDPGLYHLANWRWKTAIAGLVYGLVLAVVGAGIIMPIWLGVVGVPNPPTAPAVTTPSLLWHAVYGIVLGVVFPSVAD